MGVLRCRHSSLSLSTEWLTGTGTNNQHRAIVCPVETGEPLGIFMGIIPRHSRRGIMPIKIPSGSPVSTGHTIALC